MATSCLQVNCVVVGFDQHFNYQRLTHACCYLHRKGVKFVATNTDAGLPMGPGKFLPGLYCARCAHCECIYHYVLIQCAHTVHVRSDAKESFRADEPSMCEPAKFYMTMPLFFALLPP